VTTKESTPDAWRRSSWCSGANCVEVNVDGTHLDHRTELVSVGVLTTTSGTLTKSTFLAERVPMLTTEFKKSSYSGPNGNCLEARWTTSTRSGAAGHCVETRRVTDLGDVVVEVRDSKNRDGSVLGFTAAEWDAFIAGAKNGEFDL
jgi:hypothetical protein